MFRTISKAVAVAALIMAAAPGMAAGFIGDVVTIKRVQGGTTIFKTVTGEVGAGFEYTDNFFSIDVTENEIVFTGGNFSIGDIFYEFTGLDFDGDPQTPNVIEDFAAIQMFNQGGTLFDVSRATMTPDGAFRMSFAQSTGGAGATARIIFGAATPAVPEPATWAMMIAGFGMVGGTMRHRQTVGTAQAANA